MILFSVQCQVIEYSENEGRFRRVFFFGIWAILFLAIKSEIFTIIAFYDEIIHSSNFLNPLQYNLQTWLMTV